MTYSEKLKDPRWQKKRLKILSRDKFTCLYCKDKETTLHVHHLAYNGDPWDAKNKDLQTVCEDCHTIIGTFKKQKCTVLSAFVNYPSGLLTIKGWKIKEDNTGRIFYVFINIDKNGWKDQMVIRQDLIDYLNG